MLPLALPFPNISPEIFSFEFQGYSFALRWYALSYIVGILIGLKIMKRAISSASLWAPMRPVMTHNQADQLIIYIILGIIIGGRLGFVLFYHPAYYFAHPEEILKLWNGGMSFHGGLIGVVIATLIYTNLTRLPILSTGDVIVLGFPPGIFLVRSANFINAELWGYPTNAPWGVIFPGELAQNCPDIVGVCARHPSQLYEGIFEGLVLGAILWVVFRRGGIRQPGRIMGLFFIGYAIARFIIEFFRVADAQFITPDNPLGHVVHFGGGLGLSMGQMLTLPVFIVGFLFFLHSIPRFQAYTTPIGQCLALAGKPFAIALHGVKLAINGIQPLLAWLFRGVKFIAKLPWIFDKK